jgi:membrane protease YdiL (CAAX protease family)
LIFVFLALIAGQIVAAIVTAILHAAGVALPETTGLLFVTAITELCALPFAWWLLPTVSLVSLKKLGFVRPSLATVGIAVAGVIVANFGASAVGWATDALSHTPHPQVLTTGFVHEHTTLSLVIFIAAGAVIAPIAEETLFRLFLFNLGMRYLGFWWGAILSSILFGLSHGDPFNAPALAVVGLTLCGVYYYSKNAYASMIAHGLFNAITIVAILIDPNVAKG